MLLLRRLPGPCAGALGSRGLLCCRWLARCASLGAKRLALAELLFAQIALAAGPVELESFDRGRPGDASGIVLCENC